MAGGTAHLRATSSARLSVDVPSTMRQVGSRAMPPGMSRRSIVTHHKGTDLQGTRVTVDAVFRTRWAFCQCFGQRHGYPSQDRPPPINSSLH